MKRVKWYEVAAVALVGAGLVAASVGAQSYLTTERAQREACTRSGFVDTIYVGGVAYCVKVYADSTMLVKSPWYDLKESNK